MLIMNRLERLPRQPEHAAKPVNEDVDDSSKEVI
jgi:hypothetical protein